MKIVIAPQARDDLRAIAKYTTRTWSARQAKAYLFKLRARFQWIAENPGLGRPCDGIAPGYRFVAEGAHLIFYEVSEGYVEIIGLPHASMDIAAYFDDDAPTEP
ncbi:MAG: type II toxin-antitoxin system RelE/ParE family toxin [Pseudomonadota bacterium]